MLNDNQFVEQSLINSFYYLRSLREYCTRIQVSFPSIYPEYIKRSEDLSKQCEELEMKVLKYANFNIPKAVLDSGSFVTKYTLECELLTEKLFGIDINTSITEEELNISPGNPNINDSNKEIVGEIEELNNQQSILANEFIAFAEEIYLKIKNQDLFAFYYNSLNGIIIEEMNLFRENLERLKAKSTINPSYVVDNEYWANNFFFGVSSFIRGEIDPYYQEIFNEANNFVTEYKNIVLEYENIILSPENQKNMTLNSLELAKRFQTFLSGLIDKILKKEIYFISAPITKDNNLTAVNYFIYNLEKTLSISNQD